MYDIAGIFEVNTVDETVKILQEKPTTKIVCGGTDLLLKIRARQLLDVWLLRVAHLQELKGIYISDSNLVIGSAEVFNSIASNQLVASHAQALASSSSLVGGHEIRNVASIGGNLCNGAVSAESAAPLLALDAQLRIAGSGYERILSIHDFYVAPGQTALKEGELLTSIILPLNEDPRSASSYVKFGQRRAMEIPTLGCAVSVRLSENLRYIEKIRLALTLAGPIPLRCRDTETRMEGLPLTSKTIESIGSMIQDEIAPRDSWRASKDFRIRLAVEITRRVTLDAISRAGGIIDG